MGHMAHLRHVSPALLHGCCTNQPADRTAHVAATSRRGPYIFGILIQPPVYPMMFTQPIQHPVAFIVKG